jgi:DNA polymerase-3 subunit beta
MKLTITKPNLLSALAVVKPVTSRSGLPIVSNVLLVANEKSATLTGTDLDTFLRVRADAVVADKGDVAVRASLLFDIARSADGETITLETDKAGNLHIVSGSGRFKLATVPTKDFPAFPRVKDPVEFNIEDSLLRSLLAATSFAASADSTKLTLGGALLRLNGAMTVVACDGRRLAIVTTEAPAKNKLDRILPSAAIKELQRLLGTDADKPARCSVALGQNLAQFDFGDVTVLTKLIEGQYPDYTKIMPAAGNPVATLDRELFLAGVDRCALVADMVTLTFTRTALTIASDGKKGKELLGDAASKLLVPASREVSARMAASFLREALAATAESAIEFHYDPRGLALLKTLDSAELKWSSVVSCIAAKSETKIQPAKK